MEWETLNQISEKISPSVEGSMAFTELASHLHRMALLNDYAVTISSSHDLDQIIQRTFAFLQRAFNSDRIILSVLSPDGKG